MKILHTSDWHVGRRIRGRDRSHEHRAVLSEIVSKAVDNHVDLTLVAGDVFDTSAPGPGSEEIVWRTLLELSEISPVIVIAGNHDNAARLEAVSPLLERAGVIMKGFPAAPDEGGLVYLEDLGIKVGLLPFVSQRGIVKVFDIMNLAPDQHAGKFEERMGQVIDALTSSMGPDTVNVLLSHLTVHGGVAGGGERTAHVFGYAIPSSHFPGHLSYVALGHLHRQQKMPHAAAVWYSGSPLQLDFGEVNDRKGALLVEVEPGQPAAVTSLPLTAGKPLVSIRGTVEQVVARADEVRDAHVRVELIEKGRVGLADEVRSAIPGAVEVVLEGPTPNRRIVEQRQNLDPIEAFGRYLEQKGIEDQRVEALFAELLDEAHS